MIVLVFWCLFGCLNGVYRRKKIKRLGGGRKNQTADWLFVGVYCCLNRLFVGVF